MNDMNYPGFDDDAAAMGRDKARNEEEQEQRKHLNKTIADEYTHHAIKIEQTQKVDLPEYGKELNRTNLAMLGPPPIPPFSTAVLGFLGGSLHLLGFLVLAIAAMVLIYLGLEPITYMLPKLFRWGATIGVSFLIVLTVHRFLERLSERGRKILEYVLILLVVVGMAALGVVRGLNATMTERQSDESVTADEAEQRTAQTDKWAVLIHVVLGLAMEGMAAVQLYKALTAVKEHLPAITLYARRRRFERKIARAQREVIRLRGRLIELRAMNGGNPPAFE